jgi:acetoin utilization protein AcuB
MEKNLSQYMMKSPSVCDPSMFVIEAYTLMRELDVRHLPVVKDEKLVGLISERDLREAKALPQCKILKVSEVMKTEVYTVSSLTHLRNVVIDMADLKYGSAVVVNPSNEVVGIFTTIDALRTLAKLLDDPTSKEFLIGDYVDDWVTPKLI